MTATLYNTGGAGATGPRMTDSYAAMTREHPTWTATLTGGDIPDPGHVISSLSYARLCDEIQDWLLWHYDHSPPDVPDDYDGGEGFRTHYDYRFPEPANDALDRYWRARKQGTVDGRAVADIYNELRARAEDLMAMLYLSEQEVWQFIEEGDLRRAGRTEDDLRAWREQREAES